MPKARLLKKSWGEFEDIMGQDIDKHTLRREQQLKKEQGIDPNAPHHGEKFKNLHGQHSAKEIWNKLQAGIWNLISKTHLTDENGFSKPFSQWLAKYGLAALRAGKVKPNANPNKEIAQSTSALLSRIEALGQQTFQSLDTNTLESFKKLYGTNVQDWVTGQKKAGFKARLLR